MNRYFDLTPAASRIAGQRKCAPDLGWFDIPLAVEHLGIYDHAPNERKLADRARVSALKEMGFAVEELTGDLADDLLVFEAIALRIAKRLGKRIPKQYRGETPARLEFRRELHSWNKSYGRLRGPS